MPTPAVVQTITAGISASADFYQAIAGPDGRIWFTEYGTGKLAAVTTAGAVTEYPLGAGAQPNGITIGADGALTPYPIAGAHIASVTLGPDNNVWFADFGNVAVGKITPSGAVTEYRRPPARF